MKPYFLVLVAAALLTSCAGSSSEQKADSTTVSPETAVVTSANISEYAGYIDGSANARRILTLHNFKNGNSSYAIVAIYNEADHPLRLYMYPEGKITDGQSETWVYLDSLSGKPVLLREMIKTHDKVTENAFYYGNDSLLQAETRSAKDLSALENATIDTFEPTAGTSAYTADSLSKSLLKAVKEGGKAPGQDSTAMARQQAAH